MEVKFPRAPHVVFNQETRVIRCEHCPKEESLDECDPEGHIAGFAKAHEPCPNPSTEESRRKANNAEFNAGTLRGFGLL